MLKLPKNAVLWENRSYVDGGMVVALLTRGHIKSGKVNISDVTTWMQPMLACDVDWSPQSAEKYIVAYKVLHSWQILDAGRVHVKYPSLSLLDQETPVA